jgi:glyoxylase-like metal-dependent hydrolase (beta-lactamase superfamily II)
MHQQELPMTLVSRRAVTLALPSISIAAAVSGRGASAVARSATPATVTPLAQIKIGRFTITALSDGYADMPFAYFTGRTPQEIEQAAGGVFAARSNGIRLMYNQFLVDDGESLILIDTGPGGAMGKSGLLPAALQSIGVQAHNIDAVVITHMHRDHIGSLIAGGRQNFPKAELYIDRREVAHWSDPAKRASAPEFMKSSFDTALEAIRLYPKLQAIDGERQIARGVSTVDLTGHTPGHTGIRIEDNGKSLFMVADMLFHPAIHPTATDIGFVFEQDPAAARAMRTRFFPRAVEEKALLAATHMPFPGLGRIVSDGGKLRWVTAEWARQDDVI